MNGELYQICYILAAAKDALRTGNPINFMPDPHEEKIEFQMLPTIKMPAFGFHRAEDVKTWYALSLSSGLTDIKLLTPVVGNRILLGFSNMTANRLICYYRSGRVTSYTAHWTFDSIRKGWNILYTESEWFAPPTGKPTYTNNTDSFRTVLIDIAKLARTIGSDLFADYFRKAIDLLDDTLASERSKMPQDSQSSEGTPTAQLPMHLLSLLPPSPAPHNRLFAAADKADVFGAMGSWNDEPPFLAKEKGLEQEYEALSDELLKQIRLAVLFAVNEW